MSVSRRLQGWLPLLLMSTLIVALGVYTTVREDAFLTSYNLNNLLLATMPLALVSLGQATALLVGGFDVSVAALMTFCVVLASYTLTPTTSGWGYFPGALALLAVGLATGIFNAILIRVLRLPSIIATLGTLSILQGASLWLRDHPEGTINSDVVSGLTKSVSFIPIAFIAVCVLAVLGDTVALPLAHGPSAPGRRARRDVVAPTRDADGSRRDPRVRRLLADGVDRGLLPRGAGADRLADHRQLRPREHRRGRARRREPRGWARARTSARSSPHCSSR